MVKRAALLLVISLSWACSPEPDPINTDAANSATEAVADFPEVAEVPADAIEYRLPEQIVPAASEKQFCYFMEPLDHDLYFRRLESYQGKFGHHAIFFRSMRRPEPAGTVRDCTESSAMGDLLPVMANVAFGVDQFPDGMAIKADAGTQLVIQSHYLNTSQDDIRISDVLHAYTMEREDVEVLAGFYGLSDIYFEIPNDGKDFTMKFDCDVDREANLLMIGPHMHEWGQVFTATVERAEGGSEPLIDILHWKAEMRDDPPVVEWSGDQHYQLHPGDRLSTTCVFNNDSDHPISFPEEMCATYGYYYPAAESELWICDGT